MFGVQHRIAVGVPCGRTPMQLPPPAPAQGVVDGVSYQRVRKQKDLVICLLWPDEKPRYQGLRHVIRLVEEVHQRPGCKLLAEHRGRLRRLLVGRVQPVDAGLHQALDRAGDGRSLVLIGMAKQLVQKKRVAGRALDTAFGEGGVGGDQRLGGEGARVLGRQRTEIDGSERGARRLCPPCLVQRIALDARGHDQECGMPRHCRRQF